jgi:hypothetical protein
VTGGPQSEAGRLLEQARLSGSWEQVASALVEAAFSEPDSGWVYNQCLSVADEGPWELTAVAATCLGHLGRLRGYTRPDTAARLQQWAAPDPRVAPYVREALEDLEVPGPAADDRA